MIKKSFIRSWEYEFPANNPLQALVDFYALSLVNPDAIRSPGVGVGYVTSFHEDLADAMEQAKTKSVNGVFDLMLEAIYRAISCEIFHFQAFYDDMLMKKFLEKSRHKDVIRTLKRAINPKNNLYDRSVLTGYNNRYNIIRKAVPDPERLFEAALEMFSAGDEYWHQTFGGKPWIMIANGGFRLLAARNGGSLGDKIVAVDHAIDLAHNTGSIFTKWPDINVSKDFLDWKRRVRSPWNYVNKLSSNLRSAFTAAMRKQTGESVESLPIRSKYKDVVNTIKDNPTKVMDIPTDAREKFIQEYGDEIIKGLFLHPESTTKLSEDVWSALIKYWDNYFINENSHNIKYMPKKYRVEFLRTHGDKFAEGLTKDPSAIDYMPEKYIVEFFRTHGGKFAEGLTKDPSAIQYVPGKYIAEFFRTHGDKFAEGLVEDPSAIKYVPYEYHVDFLRTHGDKFAEGLTKYPNALYYMPEEYRVDFLRTHGDKFAEGLVEYPSAIADVPKEYRVDFLRTHGDKFAEGLTKNPRALEYVPEEYLAEFLRTRGDKFAEGLTKNPGSLYYIPEEYRVDFLRTHGDKFAEGLTKNPNDIHYVPYEYRVDFLRTHGAKFAEGLTKDPRAIEYIPEEFLPNFIRDQWDRLPNEIQNKYKYLVSSSKDASALKVVLKYFQAT